MPMATSKMRANPTSDAAIAAWKKDNAHKQVSLNNAQSNQSSHHWQKTNPHLFLEDTKAPLTLRAAPKNKPKQVKKAPGVKEVRNNSDSISFHRDFDLFKATLHAGKMMPVTGFGKRTKPSIFNMVKMLRDDGFEVLTVSSANKAVGWVLAPALLNALSGDMA